MGGATGLQAKEKTRQEQGKRREAERFFEGHFHLFWFNGSAQETARRHFRFTGIWVVRHSFFEAEPSGVCSETS